MMSSVEKLNQTVKQVAEDVLGPRDAKELWGAGFRAVLPVTPQNFSMGGILPAVLYMMRWGHRRGLGQFIRTYGKPEASKMKDKAATIAKVSKKLTKDQPSMSLFKGDTEQAILSDMLLAFCLENKNRAMGRDQPVQRVFPTHYFSSWIDLPETIANLRGIPELIVAILVRQPAGVSIKPGKHCGHFALGAGFEENTLMNLLGSGTSIKGHPDNLRSDCFDEDSSVGVDQLLTIRLAQSLGEAPQKIRGESPEISNQQPEARRAAEYLYEDFNVFLRAYGAQIPRQSLLPMIESCLCVGLTNIFLSTLTLMLAWERGGAIPSKTDQECWPLFVDCSASLDSEIRRLSEECMDDLMQRLARLPVCFMCLRILDQRARAERLKGLPPAAPDPANYLDYLGALVSGGLEDSRDIERDIRRTCFKLAEALKDMEETRASEILENDDVSPAWRLAEALVVMMGDKLQFDNFRKFLDSCMMMDEPNGIGRKRKTIIRKKMTERRSIVLTNTVLDFLVHRHLRKAKKGTGQTVLSLEKFIDILRDRYGFYIDTAPPGLSVSDDVLRKNRGHLERRLRDLGLFMGVNDAESMKRLRQRFVANDETQEPEFADGDARAC